MPPEAAPLMQATGVDAGYGTMQVLWGVDLDVRSGETVLLLGANGAGKTTFLKSLVGLIEPCRASINPTSDFRNVVLPAPLAPSSSTVSPARTSRSTPQSTCMVP